MDQINQKNDINTLIEDISYIKTMITKNNPFLHEAGISKGMQVVTLATGIITIFFSGVFQWLIMKYETFSLIPSEIRLPLFIVLGIFLVLIVFYKQHTIFSTVKISNPTVTFTSMIASIYNRHVIHAYLPPAIITLSLSIYFLQSGYAHLLIPTIAIGLGLITNGAAIGFRISEMFVMGYWLLLSGIISLVFNHISACISISYTIGLSFILFSIAAHISSRKKAARCV